MLTNIGAHLKPADRIHVSDPHIPRKYMYEYTIGSKHSIKYNYSIHRVQANIEVGCVLTAGGDVISVFQPFLITNVILSP